jgi:hypothetical protein
MPKSMALLLFPGAVAALVVSAPLGSSHVAARADRAVAWFTASGAALERDLNSYAARGLRVAAVSEGLPCAVTVMQTPASGGAAQYRVVQDRSLAAALGELPDAGFEPRFAPRMSFGRAEVIFERVDGIRAVASWRLIEFADLDALEPAIARAARDGYQPRLLARAFLKSWPGMSEKGLILAARTANGAARDAKVVVGTSRNVDQIAKSVADATTAGWHIDLLLSSARDGSRELRRERLVAVMTRPSAGVTTGPKATVERSSSFGIFGKGPIAGAVPFWNEYAFAWTPADRRQVWASPIRLTTDEGRCVGLDFKLRLDAPHDHAWSIVGLVARPLETGGFELVYLTDQGS